MLTGNTYKLLTVILSHQALQVAFLSEAEQLSDPVWSLSLSSNSASQLPPVLPRHHRPLLAGHGAVQEAAGLQPAGELLEVGVEAHGGGRGGRRVGEPGGHREGHLADVDVRRQELGGWSQHRWWRLCRVAGGS